MTSSEQSASLSPLPAPTRSGAVAEPALTYVDPHLAAREGELDWRRVLGAIQRFKWLIVSITVVGGMAGAAATRFVKPQYQAQATIWIDQTDRRGGGGVDPRGPIRQGQLLEPVAWVDLIQSYMVLDRVVRDQRLYLSVARPADSAALATFGIAERYQPGAYELTVDSTGRSYQLASANGIELEHGVVGDSVGVRLGFRWVPTASQFGAAGSVRFTVATLRDGARRLEEALEVRADQEGNFLHLALRGANPARIAAIANAVAQRYVEVAAELKLQKLTELRKILDEQLGSARQNLSDAEVALERFSVHTITLPSGRGARGGDTEQDPAVKGFFDLQVERDQAQRDHDALERVVAQARDSGVSPTALEAIAAVQRNADLTQALKELVSKQAELRALRYQYTDAHPRVQRLVGAINTLERQTIPALASSLARELAGRAADLGRRVDTGSRTLRQIPPQTIEEARLRRRVTLAETLYTTLQRRYEEARLAEASTTPDVRILDAAAVPQRPVKNTAPRMILVALFGSLGLAGIAAVLLDRADPRVRYPEHVSRDMGLPILGALPHLNRRRNGGNGAAGRTEPDVAQLVEALRGICLNLVHAYGTAGPMLVTITSPGPGEGKSFLSANLAHSFAEGGHRTLLVDADIRRGVLHRRLAARRRPGLTDCLRGEVPFEAIVQDTAYPLLTLIGCGTRVHNAPELLSSPAMARLIQKMRSAYDVILLDSPPLAGGVDPFILGTRTGSLLMVLRTGQSHREMAGTKLEMLRRLPVRLLGAVLNDVPADAGYGYYSYYLPGYEAADEHPAGHAAVIS
jgi:tyrosine-protein kinase Etk/Wzc